MRRVFTRRWSTPPRDIESRANAAITIRRAAHCARHSRRADHEVARRARSVRRGCERWPLAKAHDRGESNQHPALLERQDCTLVAWYASLYAPRTGGAYDAYHRTAGIAGRTRRRGGGVAAHGARAV